MCHQNMKGSDATGMRCLCDPFKVVQHCVFLEGLLQFFCKAKEPIDEVHAAACISTLNFSFKLQLRGRLHV